MEDMKTLKEENEKLKQGLNQVFAEKNSLDHYFVTNVREAVSLRTQLILKENQMAALQEKNKNLESLVKSIESTKKKTG